MKNLLAFAVLASAAAFAPGASAAPDPFAAACMAKGNATQSGCDCQARLARTSFTASERNLAIVGLDGRRRDQFLAAMGKMKQPQRVAFVGKMQTLQRRALAECK